MTTPSIFLLYKPSIFSGCIESPTILADVLQSTQYTLHAIINDIDEVTNDMANTITTSIIDPLEDICLSKASILAAAKAKDDEELRRRLAAAAAAEAKAQAESNGEGVKSGTIDKPVMAYKM